MGDSVGGVKNVLGGEHPPVGGVDNSLWELRMSQSLTSILLASCEITRQE